MRRPLPLILAALALIAITSSVFTVSEGQTALVIRLGQLRGGAMEPGLHFKLPLIDDVRHFDARLLSWDGDPERIPVKDSKFIYVDSFARWRIADPIRFFNAVRDETGAQSRLDDVLDGSIRDVVSEHFLLELVRTTDEPIESARLGFGPAQDEDVVTEEEIEEAIPGTEEMDADGQRLEVRNKIFKICQRKLQELDLGIELIDLRIKRIDYTEEVVQEVYNRMISQQERLAERYRAQGEGKRAEISGGTQRERQRIESESYRRAQEIMGAAEGESTRIYADAYGQDEDLYKFVKSLETFEEIFGDDDMLILSTDSELLQYLKRVR